MATKQTPQVKEKGNLSPLKNPKRVQSFRVLVFYMCLPLWASKV